ncbi:MAG: hypothetical protein ACI8RU_002959, partial [Zhongshania aliphaticivorans]
QLIPILNYNGTPITAKQIRGEILTAVRSDNVRPLRKQRAAKESV